MGGPRDAWAVVDSGGAVEGIDRLRVVDASIMPCVPSVALNPTVLMVAERIAETGMSHAQRQHESKGNDMTNEEFVRQAYAIAEVKDVAGWIACFNPDGVFVDMSVGMTYRGPGEVGKPVENYGTAFSDMHRELHDVYVSGDVVIVELALQGTHDGPLWLPQGILPPTGNRMDAPCCDVFRLVDGRIQLFDCYPSGTVILGQLGVLGNLGAALRQEAVAFTATPRSRPAWPSCP
jgi:ketosteroid isomerase-like protein